MKTFVRPAMVLGFAVIISVALSMASVSGLAEPSGDNRASASRPTRANSPKDDLITKYVGGCRKQPAQVPGCDKLRKEAVEILKEDLHTLGSSANRRYFLTILRIFKSDESELRVAAADALGMIGLRDNDGDLLSSLVNDPVPDVRRALAQSISQGKGSAIKLLGQRVMSMSTRTGLTPDPSPDPSKLALPVVPDSVYLYFGSDASVGRLAYVAKNMDKTMKFFKGKARKGPFTFEDFQKQYRYQIQDEQAALDREQEAQTKELERAPPPDPTNTQAFMNYMEKMQSVSTGRSSRMVFDSPRPELFGTQTVYVLEERQIGQRMYPTKYVLLYQERTLNTPGYRLSWMTVPDAAIAAVQAASLVEEKEALAGQAEEKALRKKQEELDALTKKKDAAEKKQFKKGQEDLEKALGF